jgi:hypothetical protein
MLAKVADDRWELQDYYVKELRLTRTSNMDQGNAFLPGSSCAAMLGVHDRERIGR